MLNRYLCSVALQKFSLTIHTHTHFYILYKSSLGRKQAVYTSGAGAGFLLRLQPQFISEIHRISNNKRCLDEYFVQARGKCHRPQESGKVSPASGVKKKKSGKFTFLVKYREFGIISDVLMFLFFEQGIRQFGNNIFMSRSQELEPKNPWTGSGTAGLYR